MASETAVLLISCPDQKGLVAAVSEFVYSNGGNIVHAEQHVDVPENTFFHRVEWELNGFAVAPPEIGAAFSKVAERFNMKWYLRFSYERPRVAVFVSKFDHCLADLLYHYRVGELNGDIVAVISNHPDLESQIAPLGIPYHLFPITRENKPRQEEQELEILQSLGVELIVLARYMQVLSPRFVRCYPYRIINIHHSFLPAFVGAKPYHQAYERGVKLIGATSHYVTEDLDEGPIIEQDVCRVTHRDSLDRMISMGRELERRVLTRAVRLHLQHRVLPYGRKTVVFD
jgi:formyltetrahydrofolate deformylase